MKNAESIKFRTAEANDLNELVALLSDDELGRTRESNTGQIDQAYEAAFKEILADPNNEILVGYQDGEIIACLQLTYIPNLTLKGTRRALIEGVRTKSTRRGQGVGRLLFEESFRRAKERGCKLVQLTTNKSRTDALRFYEALGFKASHEGMKLTLE